MTASKLERNFTVNSRFNPFWNKDYDFSDAKNLAEIAKQDAFDVNGPLTMTPYKAGGGDVITSPWGSNRALDGGQYAADFVYAIAAEGVVNADKLANLKPKPLEFCSKELVVDPNNMLSLQRHRGRQEHWDVKAGVLTVVLDGERIDVPAGQSIFIPQGAVHCMCNVSDAPVTVVELQTGVCREEDNVRLADFSKRPTYPITTETEFKSAQIYGALCDDIAQKLNCTPKNPALSVSLT